MKKAAVHSTSLPAKHHVVSTALHVRPMIFDTAWRIVLPVAAMAVLGILADAYFDSKPWLALLGVAVGFVFASILVKHQVADEFHDEK
jgi:hypothetical protein